MSNATTEAPAVQAALGDAATAATFVDLSTRVAAHAARRPTDEALVCEGRRLDWLALNTRINRLANVLIGLGVAPNDKVAILARPSVEYVEIFIGTLRAGACLVPLSPMASAEQLAGMIEDSGAKVLFLSQDLREAAAGFPPTLAPFVSKRAVALDFEADGWLSYAALMGAASGTAPDVAIAPNLDFNIIYSSGTTGVPKGIVHDHETRTLTLDNLVTLGFGPGCRTLLSTPLYSNTTITAFLPTIGLGGTTVLMRKFDAAQYLRLAEAERITHTMLVPVQYQRLLDEPSFASADLSAFQLKMSTSAPLRAELKRQVVEHWPGRLLEIYGMTEGGGACILDATAYPDKLDTVGQPAFDCEIRILDDQGRELPRGEIGEIVGRSRIMMKGYHNKADKTAEMIWRDADGNLFFKSGDMGYFDEDGFLHLSDRKKDMIISGGFNVFATDLEKVLISHPAVTDVAVIGVPSREWGETPLGFVVTRPGAELDAEDLRQWANARLGKTQRISGIEFRDSLPRSTIGKILKRELREPYWRSA